MRAVRIMGLKRTHLLLLLLGCLLFLPQVAAQESGSPQISSEGPPRSPVDARVQPGTRQRALLGLPPLKAVLLVGPIDGNEGSWTLGEIANMELAAAVLEANGVTVHRFYPGDSNVAQIESAAEGAHFLLYRGHGVYYSDLPSPNVGGFYLSSGFYSSDQIRSNLHLAPNAIVMLYGCFTAGSSSTIGDEYDIGITEASRRVAQYSDPFFDVGAAGYYANWFGNAFAQFLTYLFSGQTLGEAYESYFDFNPNTVYQTVHPDHPEMAMWVDKDNWDYWKYNNAFAGLPDETLLELFMVDELGGIPDSLSFTATVEESVLLEPITHTVTPQNVGGDTAFDWVLATEGDWFEVAPLSGSTPDSYAITAQSFDTSRPGTYTGALTVTVTNPPDLLSPVQRIDLTLEVLAPELGGLPGALKLDYSIADQRFLRLDYALTPQNTGSDMSLAWETSTELAWLATSPASGVTPQSFSIQASGFDTTTVATYSGVLTVTVTDPASTWRSPQAMPVTLEVVDGPFGFAYLPMIMRNGHP